jgi:hypothetical protein
MPYEGKRSNNNNNNDLSHAVRKAWIIEERDEFRLIEKEESKYMKRRSWRTQFFSWGRWLRF